VDANSETFFIKYGAEMWKRKLEAEAEGGSGSIWKKEAGSGSKLGSD